jgi:hemin uptake protein HemP
MATPSRTPEDTAQQAKQERATLPRSINSRDLMGAARVLIIRHGKDDYRLQLTTAGKLILTK